MLVLEGFVGLHRTIHLQLLQLYGSGHRLTWITVLLNGLPWKLTEIILSFLRLHPHTEFWTLFDCAAYSISSKRFLPTAIDIRDKI